MTKLNKKRVRWLIDQVEKHNKKPKDICFVYNITERRGQQLAKEYRKKKRCSYERDNTGGGLIHCKNG